VLGSNLGDSEREYVLSGKSPPRAFTPPTAARKESSNALCTKSLTAFEEASASAFSCDSARVSLDTVTFASPPEVDLAVDVPPTLRTSYRASLPPTNGSDCLPTPTPPGRATGDTAPQSSFSNA